MVSSFSIPYSLAVLPEFPSLSESIAYQINGLIVVFIALSSIWGMLEITGWFFRRLAARPAAITPLATPVAAASRPEEIPPEILAVIAAAVATVVKQPHRISSVAADSPSRDWASEGRRAIFGSHRVR